MISSPLNDNRAKETMDNLAHALTAVATTATVQPKLIKTNPIKAIVASAIIVNIPDIDIILGIFGQTFYHFHHRGFTHSFMGLPVMLALAWLFLKLFWPDVLQKLGKLGTLRFLSIQLLFGHFFLDYLTSYGVMFFYPLSLSRFAWPLMFIIDPVFWIITLTGLVVVMVKNKSGKPLRLYGISTGVSVLIWWFIIAMFKYKATALSFPSTQNAKAYPGPLAPMIWLVVDKQMNEYSSAMVSFFKTDAPKVMHQNISINYVHDGICDNLKGNIQAEQAFKRYQIWATETLCMNQGPDQCLCHSMRYTFGMDEQSPYFGSISLDSRGQINFLRQNTGKAIDGFFNTFMGEDQH